MKKWTMAVLILGTVLMAGGSASAAIRTATYTIENMTCVSCSFIVKKTLASVRGVTAVVVSYEKKTAVVTFDDAQTSVEALAAASAGAGYPAHPVAAGGRDTRPPEAAGDGGKGK